MLIYTVIIFPQNLVNLRTSLYFIQNINRKPDCIFMWVCGLGLVVKV